MNRRNSFTTVRGVSMLRRSVRVFAGFLVVMGGICPLSAQSVPGGIIRTVAGTDWTFTIPGAQALNAPLGEAYGMALDSSGNLYVADYQNSVVVKIAPNGTATTVAGNGIAGFSGEGGAAVNASLNQPASVAVDRSGNLYISDTFNNRIRRVSAADGTITTIAGPGFGYGGDGGPAVNALLELPLSLVVDASGNLFFYDFGSARIRKIASNGQISTVAGNGRTGYSGEGAATSVATEVLNQMALDSAGNLYFGDQEHHVRKLTLAGQTVLVAGNGQAGFSGDNGPAVNAALEDPDGLAIDSSGNIYIADFNNGRIRVVNPSGMIVTYAGIGSSNIIDSGDNGPALKAGMNPIALAVGSSGLVYLADYSTTVIRRIDTAGAITTIAGNSEYRSAPDGTPAINAFFDYPEGLAFDRSGNLIVADFDAARIRKVTPSGSFSTIAGVEAPGCCGDGGPATAALLDGPNSVAVDAQNNIYFTDSNNHRVRRIGTDGKITTVAGAGRFSTGGSFDGDGQPAALAHLDTPSGLAFDTNGNLYIADTGNNVVRRVAPPTDGTGTISTFAGTPLKPGFSGDGTPATKAPLNQPYGLAIDAAGNVYIADAGNNSVRMVSPGGVISTFAGNQKAGFSGDGGPANRAFLNDPVGLTLDPAGNLYILENSGNRIRQVTPAGIITTIAGTGTAGFSGDGGPSASAQLNF